MRVNKQTVGKSLPSLDLSPYPVQRGGWREEFLRALLAQKHLLHGLHFRGSLKGQPASAGNHHVLMCVLTISVSVSVCTCMCRHEAGWAEWRQERRKCQWAGRDGFIELKTQSSR